MRAERPRRGNMQVMAGLNPESKWLMELAPVLIDDVTQVASGRFVPALANLLKVLVLAADETDNAHPRR